MENASSSHRDRLMAKWILLQTTSRSLRHKIVAELFVGTLALGSFIAYFCRQPQFQPALRTLVITAVILNAISWLAWALLIPFYRLVRTYMPAVPGAFPNEAEATDEDVEFQLEIRLLLRSLEHYGRIEAVIDLALGFQMIALAMSLLLAWL